jgi:membrane associated rhomboid family serine protease
MPDGGNDGSQEQATAVILAAAPDRRRVEGWMLTLLSLGMHPLLTRVQGGFAVAVPLDEAARAHSELQATEVEEAEARRDRSAAMALDEAPATPHAVAGAVALMVALMAFHAVTGPSRPGAGWFTAGTADAGRMLHGEWWRALTALTLHADLAHVVSNAGIGAIVVAAVMRAVGVGWGLALVVAAGVAGNLANAWIYQGQHLSIGFSTAVFGAIGILGGLAAMRARRRALGRRTAWIGLGTALALLGVLGTSPETDVLGHLLGGLAGVALGLVTGWSQWRPRSWAGQTLMGLAVLAMVVGAWWVARA